MDINIIDIYIGEEGTALVALWFAEKEGLA